MYCTECGKPATVNDRFCENCGHELVINDPPFEGAGQATAIGFGIAAMLFGALGVWIENANHSECGSAIVGALAQSGCQQVSLIWTGGILLLILGAVLVIAGAIAGNRRN
jgi:hypothetical protein